MLVLATAPTVTTTAATVITATSGTLNGTVSSNGAGTTVTFQYGSTTSYGSTVTAAQSPLAAGAINAPASATIGGLACNTFYHFRALGANSVGPANGADASFTTAACVATAPTVATDAATAITPTRATLNGVVSSNGASHHGQLPVRADHGLRQQRHRGAEPAAGGGEQRAGVGADRGTGLQHAYHFRAAGVNSAGTSMAPIRVYHGACAATAPTAATDAATAITPTRATLNGDGEQQWGEHHGRLPVRADQQTTAAPPSGGAESTAGRRRANVAVSAASPD